MRWFVNVIGFLGASVGVVVQTAFVANHGRFIPEVYSVWLVIVAAMWGGVYALCQAKKRSPGNWLTATFFFGPIPLLALAFMPGRQHRIGESRQCPHCISEIPKAASVCRYCQRDLTSGSVTISAPSR